MHLSIESREKDYWDWQKTHKFVTMPFNSHSHGGARQTDAENFARGLPDETQFFSQKISD
jgi:hypothetical protein